MVNTQHYRQRLLDLEKDLEARGGRERELGRAHAADSARDIGDASLADETASEDFTEAETDSTLLGEVREALRRIDQGTFGRCVVDGGPIETKRLDAVPWAQYCLKHQALVDAEDRPKTPTL